MNQFDDQFVNVDSYTPPVPVAPPVQQQPKQRPKPGRSTWVVGTMLVITTVFSCFGTYRLLGGFLNVATYTALTGLYVLITGRPSWANFSGRAFGAVAAGLSIAVMTIGAIFLGAMLDDEPQASNSARVVAPAQPTPEPAVTFVSSIPKLNAAQEASLMNELAKIDPLLANEKSVDNARNQCHSILGGTSAANELVGAKARFTGRKVKTVSDSEARRIIAVIKANGFCKPVPGATKIKP